MNNHCHFHWSLILIPKHCNPRIWAMFIADVIQRHHGLTDTRSLSTFKRWHMNSCSHPYQLRQLFIHLSNFFFFTHPYSPPPICSHIEGPRDSCFPDPTDRVIMYTHTIPKKKKNSWLIPKNLFSWACRIYTWFLHWPISPSITLELHSNFLFMATSLLWAYGPTCGASFNKTS